MTVGPFAAELKGVHHRLYVEARDREGDASLGIVDLFVTRANFERGLLIVDDTRRAPDTFLASSPDCPRAPIGQWPNAAELDTFLFARGNVPLRCDALARNSSPGLFEGYDFDTLGTRGMLDVPTLGLLGKYRRVIWYVDQAAANYTGALNSPTQPKSMLRYMSENGRMNVLSAYAKSGGRTWIAGGGAALASGLPNNDPSNDSPSTIFSSTRPNELGPGRFMYEAPHWRSEIRVTFANASITRFRGRFEGTPEYAALPSLIQQKTPATDPLPPTRTRPSDFYQSFVDVEFLQRPNEILEEGASGPRPAALGSALDTLYQVTGTGLPTPDVNPHNVIMTHYHGSDCGPVVFTGFSLWSFQHDQCAQLVDFVLQTLWGMSREPDVKLVRRAATRRLP